MDLGIDDLLDWIQGEIAISGDQGESHGPWERLAPFVNEAGRETCHRIHQ